jgi:hypothetical protein
VKRLAPLVEQAGCGFGVDSERPDLIFVYAPSITCFMQLAGALLIEAGLQP